MKRLTQAAKQTPGGAKILDDMPETVHGIWDYNHEVTSKMMQYNRKWIHQQLKDGRNIIDIGADVKRKSPSIFYQMVEDYSLLQAVNVE